MYRLKVCDGVGYMFDTKNNTLQLLIEPDTMPENKRRYYIRKIARNFNQTLKTLN